MPPRFLPCPISHPKFFPQKGRHYRLRLTPSIRSQIPYGSESFRPLYRERTAVERVFSCLLTVALQDLTTRGLTSARNLCTIARISVLLVALAAHRSGHPPGKTNFVKPCFSPTTCCGARQGRICCVALGRRPGPVPGLRAPAFVRLGSRTLSWRLATAVLRNPG